MRHLLLLAVPLLTLLTLATPSAGESGKAVACGQPGQWRLTEAGSSTPLEAGPLLERMARQQVVLLGEAHDSAEDHRWQLHTLTQLFARQPRMAIGFEMFPRRVQPVLDQWVAGTLAEDEFLKRVEWDKVWGFDARDYLPLFHFARMNRLPMLALNVEHSLPEAVGKLGWDAVPDVQKEGVTRPAPPGAAYRKELQRVFDHHPAREKKGESAFPRFVEVQTLWDRAMAQVMADYLKQAPGSLVVGIMGAGHVRDGHGVAHQLQNLGVAQVGALMTWDHADNCANLGKGFADALYIVQPPAGNAPRLGVATDPAADVTGLRIVEVTAGSIAAAAGLKKGDVILEIAGRPAKSILTLRQIVQRQAPGTWLPLKIRREGSDSEIVARFPPSP
jgi:uncharacterized iron-regulated protein